ncbi:MAG: hypothetical protein IE909_12940 [Campylobacterales bacterium]|nr:hypothetical protein [Campylobacterales bacterium]
MSNNLLIVESKNDKYFIESLVEYLNLSIEIDSPICNINDYECLKGLDNLEKKLDELPKKIFSQNINKVGIILDADDKGIEKRLEFINEKLKVICSDVQLEAINDFKNSSELDTQIGCYIMNVSGNGELETVLKAIASKDKTYADCLDAWKNCLISKGKTIKDKDFDKFWVNNYLRFDTCNSGERGQADRKCRGEKAIKKDIWDFTNPILDDLKTFLKMLAK